jgi:two-component system chemotaxis response regulator CheY
VKHILLVEDDIDIREALQAALEAEGYGVTAVEHSKAAVDVLADVKELPHLVLLDLMTPVMTGWEFLKFARAKPWQSMPIVVFSATSLANQNDFAPAVEFVKKPVDLMELFAVVERRIAQR